jgi:hypothetical protein
MLSKSRYLAGLQCPKRLWHETNALEELPPYDAATEAIFEQGHLVGQLARELFSGGVALDRERFAWPQAVVATREALRQRVPLYEAAFEHRGAACRVDILVPVDEGAWDLVEVKSTTSVKDEHLDDVAFQAWVLEGAGIGLRRIFLAHLDNRYVRRGALDHDRLFALEDLTERVVPFLPAVPALVARYQETCRRSGSPGVAIGPHCKAPYACPLIPRCWEHVPEESVFTLNRFGAKAWDLVGRGILGLRDLPPETRLTERQRLQVATARAQRAHVDGVALRRFLARLRYPLHYFDLESVQFAIPQFDGTRPYQQIPFQFSLHLVEAPGEVPRPAAFLARDLEDPRAAFLSAAREAILERGSLVAFNAIFEIQALTAAATESEHGPWVEQLVPRFIDLLEPFRNFDYYHPAQLGSASLKAVLPVLAGRGYDDLEIQEGQAAGREFLRSLAPETPPEESARIREALLAYCGRDTEGMHQVVEALRKFTE